MTKSRCITTFILILSITTLVIAACETHPERTGVGEATPTPTAMMTTSPSPGASPAISPGSSPAIGLTGKLTPYDREFLTDAARGASLEVQLGNFAAQKATNEDVKRFGQRLATDHSQGGQTIRQMASNLKFTLPQELTPEQQILVSRLENLSGSAFDREYIKAMIADHVKDISEYERAAAQATIAEIKQYASQALPMLRDHLKMAREIGRKLGVKAE
ncbi:MAG TPA: DUF4142 domain-containing protein [Blastocatellia bacterium]|nr:DUF4142 domain-containing protein [Blastocatellia bacterium]